MSKEMDLLRRLAEGDNRGDFFISLELLKEVEAILAQPETEQEPVAWMHEGVDETGETVRSIYQHFYEHANLIPLYTAPPTREPLSEDKLDALAEANITDEGIAGYYLGFRDAEKAHGIIGGGV